MQIYSCILKLFYTLYKNNSTSILKNIRFLENLNTQFYKVYKKP